MIKYFAAITCVLFMIVFSSCGKGVINEGNSADASNGGPNSGPPSTTTPPGGPGGGTITPTPGPTSVEGCPAAQLTSFNFAQSNPPEVTFDLGVSGSSSILFVSVGGQETSFSFDPNSGSISLADAGQPGETIHVDVCLPSSPPVGTPTGTPTGKPTGKPSPKPEPSKVPCPVRVSEQLGNRTSTQVFTKRW